MSGVTKYVAGFVFDEAYSAVALIRKQRPDWQRGLLNGIGGHIERDESADEAMCREFAEETGVYKPDWNLFCLMWGTNNDGEHFEVDFFWAVGALDSLRSQTDEPIEIIAISDLHALRSDTVGNVPWLVAMARDFACGVYPPTIVTADYAPKTEAAH